jgi:hypothetical protein
LLKLSPWLGMAFVSGPLLFSHEYRNEVPPYLLYKGPKEIDISTIGHPYRDNMNEHPPNSLSLFYLNIFLSFPSIFAFIFLFSFSRMWLNVSGLKRTMVGQQNTLSTDLYMFQRWVLSFKGMDCHADINLHILKEHRNIIHHWICVKSAITSMMGCTDFTQNH